MLHPRPINNIISGDNGLLPPIQEYPIEHTRAVAYEGETDSPGPDTNPTFRQQICRMKHSSERDSIVTTKSRKGLVFLHSSSAVFLAQRGPDSEATLGHRREQITNLFLAGNPPGAGGLLNTRMRKSSSLIMSVVKAANTVIGQVSMATGSKDSSCAPKQRRAWAPSSQLWTSLAPYDIDMIRLREEFERKEWEKVKISEPNLVP